MRYQRRYHKVGVYTYGGVRLSGSASIRLMTVLLQVLLEFLRLTMANFDGANSCVVSFLQLYRSVANIFAYKDFNQAVLNKGFIAKAYHPFLSMPSRSLPGQRMQQTHI